VLVDRFFVHLARENERLVAEIRVHVESAREYAANHVFDKARVVVSLVDDEKLVGSLQEIVGFARHRVFDDFDEILGANGVRVIDPDQNDAPPALIVGRDRKRIECARRLLLRKADVDQLVERVLAHHRLRARAGGHPFGFHPDDASRTALIGVRDPDQGVSLFAALAAYGRPTLQSELRAQAHVGSYRPLATYDLARYRLDQALDGSRFRIASEHVERCFFEEFGETRHVHAGFVGRKIGDHAQLAVIDLRAAVDLEVHDPPHAQNAGSIEREPNLRFLRLAIGIETKPTLAPVHPSVGRRQNEMGRDLGKRGDVVRARLEMRLHDPPVVDEEIDVDRTRRKPARPARPSDRELHVAGKALERFGVEIGAQRRCNVEIGRPLGPVGGFGLIERRNRRNLGARAQSLKRGEDVGLPITEVGAYSDVELVHAPTLLSGGPEFRTGGAYRSVMQGDAVYPYVLDPKLTTQVWGGDELVRVYGKHGDPNARLGESWECWDTDRVTNGALAGSTVADLRARLGAELLGNLDPARIFPVLTKIITAHDWLSVQVHPDDAYAQRVEHQPFGKTECWYVLDAQPNAQIVYGWTRDTSRAEYERRVADGTLGALLRHIELKAGDTVYIPHGLVHAIGPGITVFETQQASDLTYRMFDYNRIGLDGKPRELQVQKAADVLDYRATTTGTLSQIPYQFEGLDRIALIADEHFVVERIVAVGEPASLATQGRPLIVMSLDAPLEVTTSDDAVTLPRYQTALIPAASHWCTVRAGAGEAAPFMFVTPPQSTQELPARLLAAGVGQEQIDLFMGQFSGNL
jgi:mannose-6-phosphate isomerase